MCVCGESRSVCVCGESRSVCVCGESRSVFVCGMSKGNMSAQYTRQAIKETSWVCDLQQ